MTKCLPPTEQAIAEAAAIIKAGGLVAFPTETVYGLGANALDASAVAQIFEAKQRPQDNPLIVHIAAPEEAEVLAHVSDMAKKLMAAFFPGPLTLLMKKKPVVPDITTAGLDSVGIRMPNHPVALALIKAAKHPIAAPSANRSGKPSPTDATHVLSDMQGRIPLILAGGECRIGVESTVLDLTCTPPMILRPGGVTKEMLLSVLDEVAVAESIMRPLRADEEALSPGMRHKHYSPEGALALVEGERALAAMRKLYDESDSACLFAFEEDLPSLGNRYCLSLGSRNAPNEMANRLFRHLRRMDDEKIRCIYSVVIDTSGIGLAIMNRLGRAAGFHFVNAEEVLK